MNRLLGNIKDHNFLRNEFNLWTVYGMIFTSGL